MNDLDVDLDLDLDVDLDLDLDLDLDQQQGWFLVEDQDQVQETTLQQGRSP